MVTSRSRTREATIRRYRSPLKSTVSSLVEPQLGGPVVSNVGLAYKRLARAYNADAPEENQRAAAGAFLDAVQQEFQAFLAERRREHARHAANVRWAGARQGGTR